MSNTDFSNRKLFKTEAERKRLIRENETPEERALRLEKQRERQSSRRQAQSDDGTAERLVYQRKHQAAFRQTETEAESAERLEYKRGHQAALRQTETEAESAERLEYKRVHQAALRQTETEAESAERLEYKRVHQAALRQTETEAESAERLEYKRGHQAALRQTETEAESAERLEYKRKHQEALRQTETEAESAERLEYKRKHQEALRQTETGNERMVRLKSRTLLYETSKTLQSKRYLNFARSQISAEVSDGLVEQHSIGSMSYSCPICDAKFWESEKLSTSTKACTKFSLCCGEGKVVLPSLDILPELLGHLLTVTDSRGKDFRNHIRAYNSSLAFCSLGANIDKELANARRGVYTFRIQGVVHHYIGSLVPNCDEAPVFAQIYIHDGTPEAEVENRQRHLGEAKLPELRALQQMLHEVNPYVSHFKHAVDRMRAQGGVDIRMIIRADGCPDPRRYNAPSAPEIAVLLPGGGYSEGVANRDIVLHAHSGSLRRIT